MKQVENIPYEINDLNKMTQSDFKETIGSIFEHSPWIAEEAWTNRPFSSITELHEKMVEIVKESSRGQQMNLINAHPRLGNRIKMTHESTAEQKGAGLSELSQEEQEEFLRLNQLYMEKFNIPFIMAVKGQNKKIIKNEIQRRMNNNYKTELNTALNEIYKIARFRLDKIVK